MKPFQGTWRKRLIVKLWMIWDKLVLKIMKVKSLDQENPFLQVRICRYHGKPIPLAEGKMILNGDRVVELHLNNEYLFHLGVHAHSPVQLSVQLVRSMERLLPKISEYILLHPYSEDIKGIYGITIIHRGAKQLGFTVKEMPKGPVSLLIKMYLRLLLICVHPEGKTRVRNKKLLDPMVVAFSKEDLLRRYPVKNVERFGGTIISTS